MEKPGGGNNHSKTQHRIGGPSLDPGPGIELFLNKQFCKLWEVKKIVSEGGGDKIFPNCWEGKKNPMWTCPLSLQG